MPQLVKGGKYVFGWSRTADSGRIAIPPEALTEYGFKPGDEVVLLSGSKRSGGFGIATAGRLSRLRLSQVVRGPSDPSEHPLPEAKTTGSRMRRLCQTEIDRRGYISLPQETLEECRIKAGDLLLVVRGSHLALGFAARGPIVEEAAKHGELEVFD
jgi:bifunctional DNA-binding transcriptional regulator/antitoxin component of YhaV-PrlF toxin-antitoxin module